MNEHALYYPYIHIQDVNWLKATLLMFSQVRRMMPAMFTPFDTHEVAEFAQYREGQEPLLGPAAIWSERAEQAQRAVAEKLRQDSKDPAFLKRFGRQAALMNSPGSALGFQIHQAKLVPELRDVLRETQLAWDPRQPEPYDQYAEYVELHPHVGEVVMSTLAIACAEGEGLDIVGDRRSERLHSSLIEKDTKAVYDEWLHPSPWPGKPRKPTGEDLFEFLLSFNCDLSNLTPDSLAAMHEDREPLRKLVTRLRKVVADMPAMDPGQERQQYFRDKTADVLKAWQSDRSNMSHYWRVFFGEGVADPEVKFLDIVAEKLVAGGEKAAAGGAAGATGAAAVGATASGAFLAGLYGAGVGLGIGILVHAGKSYFKMRRQESESAYRYLTLMEKAGVVFRSDLGASRRKKSRL